MIGFTPPYLVQKKEAVLGGFFEIKKTVKTKSQAWEIYVQCTYHIFPSTNSGSVGAETFMRWGSFIYI